MMIPREPRYAWGQRITAAVSLANDGSYPDCEPDALLVTQGEPGEVVQVGLHIEENLPVYLVEFSGNRVIGCLEEEIVPA